MSCQFSFHAAVLRSSWITFALVSSDRMDSRLVHAMARSNCVPDGRSGASDESLAPTMKTPSTVAKKFKANCPHAGLPTRSAIRFPITSAIVPFPARKASLVVSARHFARAIICISCRLGVSDSFARICSYVTLIAEPTAQRNQLVTSLFGA